MGKDGLFSDLYRDVKYFIYAFKMCQGQKLVDINGIGCHNEATAASQYRNYLQFTCLYMVAKLRG